MERTTSGWAMVLILTLAACGDQASQGVQVQRDTVGDTVIVRTLSGSAWGAVATLEPELRIGVVDGEDPYILGQVRSLAVAPDGSIYAMDTQVPALRKYGPDGAYIATFGREGEGPGEYRGPDGGLAVLPDGRVVLRDPRNARLQLYSPEGAALASWPIRGNFNTSNPMPVDTAGRPYTQMLMDPQADVKDWHVALVAFDPVSGEPADTVPAPVWDYEPPRLVARRTTEGGTSTSINSVPFSPGEHWALSPYGHMVGGLSTRYVVDQFLPDGTVLRIERAYEPVSVQADERSNQEDRARWNMRNTQPDWKWNGPAVPDEKPPFRDLFTGADGRIWVLLHQSGERIPDHEVEELDTSRPDPRPARRWREPTVFDVFEADGTYLGMVRAPGGFSLDPTPIFDDDRVWATIRDELDVPYITRFRITHPGREGRIE